ncbi:expressed unknown protein [Seminavis robusta]|uniref:Thioredoxin domain-containing protein n=1 Tax=Seminavis robusta TaxID=568900 RepID=A0A9N8H659_9STRA|nr:expressed unknown protein [Seminavis robusta]|eukprot:Sro135_g063881.1  (234) ;mRNA; f:90677-91378
MDFRSNNHSPFCINFHRRQLSVCPQKKEPMTTRKGRKRTMICVLLFALAFSASSVEAFAFPTHSLSTTRATNSHVWLSNAPDGASTHSATAPATKQTGMIEIESHADWMELLFESESESSITAVFFHATWCKFCQRFRLRWNRQLRLCSTTPSKATFASVEYSANRKLCQSLQVEHFPTIQFYYQGDLLHSASCSPKGFSGVKQRLERYLDMDPAQLEQEVEGWASQSNVLLP